MSNNKEKYKRIAKSESPEVIAALLESMAEHIENQKKLIAKLEIEKAEKEQRSFDIEEKLKLLRRDYYGRSREQRPEATDRPRDKSQKESLLFSQAMFPTDEARDESGKAIKTRWENLETIEVEIGMSAADLELEATSRGITEPKGEKWEELKNVFDTHTQIEIIERRYVKKVYKKKKYKLLWPYTIQTDDKDVIITAPMVQPTLLPGMNYSTAFVASVVADKYISHVPLERQTREMESLGLKGIKNSTLSRLCAVAAASLEPIAEDIVGELLKSDVALHLDETPWGIQNKNERDGYMWVMSNRAGSYYFFKPTRSAKVLKEILSGYTGPVVTDGLEMITDNDGVAKLPFPENFPGNSQNGDFSVTAKIVKSETYLGESTITVGGGKVLMVVENPFPREIWSPNTDWYLLLTIPFLIFCVWSVYVFSIAQLVKLSRMSRQE